MKKRERTVNLVTESEVLENQNIDLKSQLKVKMQANILQNFVCLIAPAKRRRDSASNYNRECKIKSLEY